MNILLVTSEYYTLAKAGGLADAVTALATGLAAGGHDVHVVMPKYKMVQTDSFEREAAPLSVVIAGHDYGCAVLTAKVQGVTIHLIEHEVLFRRDGIYGPTADQSYGDNTLRFALLSRGALEVALLKNFVPDVIHAHDWSGALTPVFLRHFYRKTAIGAAGTVLSIHNLAFQGTIPKTEGLSTIGMSETEAESFGLIQGESLNLLKGGIYSSDRIVAVSPTYAREIQQPATDTTSIRRCKCALPICGESSTGSTRPCGTPTPIHICLHGSMQRTCGGKRVCKAQLQDELELPVSSGTPLIGMVTRLTRQKGIEELFDPQYGAAERILTELPVQWVVLGTGERWCEDRVRELSHMYENFAGLAMYSDTLAHQIEGGSDFFLMPSRYEPCGLNQMYSMRYGTIPIVTRTGGLADTVDSSTGFHIEAHNPDAVFDAIAHAVAVYTTDREELKRMQHTAMTRDFGLYRSIEQYERLYDGIIDAEVDETCDAVPHPMRSDDTNPR